jgi:hypothetical protein
MRRRSPTESVAWRELPPPAYLLTMLRDYEAARRARRAARIRGAAIGAAIGFVVGLVAVLVRP